MLAWLSGPGRGCRAQPGRAQPGRVCVGGHQRPLKSLDISSLVKAVLCYFYNKTHLIKTLQQLLS